MYIDIHTHKQPQLTDSLIAVKSLWQDFDGANGGNYYSMGFHPWHLGNWPADMDLLTQAAAGDHIIAIGECGLDRFCETDFAVQMQAFEAQMALAMHLRKPLIIHCVRAWDEVFRMLKAVDVPVIFHGFNKGAAMLEQICAHGYYISFGAALLNTGSNACKHFPYVPGNRFFLETDDADLPIETIYVEAARLRNCTQDDVILQLESNFHTVFKK